MSKTKIEIPQFDADNFDMYMSEVRMWTKLCGLEKKDQAVALWYGLPAKHPSDIKAKIFSEIGEENLSKDDGVTKFIAKMEEAFLEKAELRSFEIYVSFFKEMKIKPGEKIREFVNKFDRVAKQAEKQKMTISNTVKALKILDDADLTPSDKKLVMSEMDFSDDTKVYDQAKAGLIKYMTDKSRDHPESKGIQLQEANVAQLEEALFSKGGSGYRPRSDTFPNNGRYGGGHGQRGGGGSGQGQWHRGGGGGNR